ncbi:hypothetical protein [Vreelandella alkaliphila]|uniref:Uncharacterized protein n=1 Tax=Vreelandella alkaliphila TaxID=272774 RepID=A0AAJ2VSG3_9GAMM|nr:hypothetical protein [Halomonas alkaliphila]MDX5979619.1 hypothetical protein [Halomonas alkaliphila]
MESYIDAIEVHHATLEQLQALFECIMKESQAGSRSSHLAAIGAELAARGAEDLDLSA